MTVKILGNNSGTPVNSFLGTDYQIYPTPHLAVSGDIVRAYFLIPRTYPLIDGHPFILLKGDTDDLSLAKVVEWHEDFFWFPTTSEYKEVMTAHSDPLEADKYYWVAGQAHGGYLATGDGVNTLETATLDKTGIAPVGATNDSGKKNLMWLEIINTRNVKSVLVSSAGSLLQNTINDNLIEWIPCSDVLGVVEVNANGTFTIDREKDQSFYYRINQGVWLSCLVNDRTEVGDPIVPVKDAPVSVDNFNPPGGVVGIPYLYETNNNFSGGPIDDFVANVAFPAGLSINTKTGKITGTPTTVETVVGLNITGTNTKGSGTTNNATLTITAAPVTPNPDSQVLFNNNATDEESVLSVVTETDLTYEATASGQRLVTNGTTSILEYANAYEVFPRSISLWVTVKDAAAQGTIIAFGDKVMIFQQSGKIVAQATNTAASTTRSDIDIVVDTTYHVIATLSNTGQPVLYIDGALQSGNAFNDYWTCTELSVGARIVNTTKSRYLNVAVDDLQIFASILSQADVTNIYNAGPE